MNNPITTLSQEGLSGFINAEIARLERSIEAEIDQPEGNRYRLEIARMALAVMDAPATMCVNLPEISDDELSKLIEREWGCAEIRPAPSAPDSWIKCSDRMPELQQEVIVFSDTVYSGMKLDWTGKGFIDIFEEYFNPGPVTHWMPLPEAPEGE